MDLHLVTSLQSEMVCRDPRGHRPVEVGIGVGLVQSRLRIKISSTLALGRGTFRRNEAVVSPSYVCLTT